MNITSEDLKKHNNPGDLWISIQGKVYDVSVWIQSGYAIHDSGHYSGKLIQLLSGNCLNGISIVWWKSIHNAHHIACNSLDYDPDLQHIPIFVVSTKLFNSMMASQFDPLARFLISYQHLTFYPVMCFGRINLLFQTIVFLFSNRHVPDRALNIAGILIFWVWFPILVSYLPNWSERLIFVFVSFAVTGIQQLQFSLNHLAADVYVGPPNGNDWVEKQTAGTLDISCRSYMDWFYGGLQFQIEHHLFPRLSRCYLRRVSPVVKELCKKHNLPYRSLSWWEANVLTVRTLRNAAIEARNLIWEAVNTHG